MTAPLAPPPSLSSTRRCRISFLIAGVLLCIPSSSAATSSSTEAARSRTRRPGGKVAPPPRFRTPSSAACFALPTPRRIKTQWRSVAVCDKSATAAENIDGGASGPAGEFLPRFGRSIRERWPPRRIARAGASSRTLLLAKLGKHTGDFNLDEILSREDELEDVSKQSRAADPSGIGGGGGGGTDVGENDLEGEKAREHEWDDDNDGIADRFVTHEIPPELDGKRIDAALVDLLNRDDDGGSKSGTSSISRSQCGMLLSGGGLSVVPPDAVPAFAAACEDAKDAGDGSIDRKAVQQYAQAVTRKSHKVEAGSVILLTSEALDKVLRGDSPTKITPQKIDINVLYEDECMIVLNKAAGIVVHPAAGNWDGTIVNALAHYLVSESPCGPGDFTSRADENDGEVGGDAYDRRGEDEGVDALKNDAVTNSVAMLRPGIVHRLDKGTTGVLVVAKTQSALKSLSEAFARRSVEKRYVSVVAGNPGTDVRIEKSIERHPIHRQKMRVVPDPSASVRRREARLSAPPTGPSRGRRALSFVDTLAFDGRLSVVQVKIETGRTHQIRVHLQDRGTPVYGDPVYGLSDRNKQLSRSRGVERPLLHAHRLELDHPETGERMVFTAPMAEDMAGVVEAIWPTAREERPDLFG